MNKVFIVRIYEIISNLERKISNRTTLTSNKIKQVEKVKDRLSSFPIPSNYSSALDLAFKTAEIEAYLFWISVSKCSGFNEINLEE